MVMHWVRWGSSIFERLITCASKWVYCLFWFSLEFITKPPLPLPHFPLYLCFFSLVHIFFMLNICVNVLCARVNDIFLQCFSLVFIRYNIFFLFSFNLYSYILCTSILLFIVFLIRRKYRFKYIFSGCISLSLSLFCFFLAMLLLHLFDDFFLGCFAHRYV